MAKLDYEYTSLKCWENAERLLNDAICLSDYKSFPTAFALSIISQEEYAKSLIFSLIKMNVIPWHQLIIRTLNDHNCKQLVGLVIEHLNPEYDDAKDFFLGKGIDESYSKALDAINILRLEKWDRWESKNWHWAEKPIYNDTSKSIFKGNLDKIKQDAFYVRINKNCEILSEPIQVTEKQTEDMIDKTKRYSEAINQILRKDDKGLLDFDKIKAAFKIMFNKYDAL